MVFTTKNVVPCIVKFLDEALVNSRDAWIRNQETKTPVTFIKVTISEEDGTVSVENNGAGILVTEHPEYKVMIPQMIFGELRTSTNYNSDETRIVGGQNGLGIKAVFIWSTFAEVDLAGPNLEGKLVRYTQRFRDNLSVIEPFKLAAYSKKTAYTKVTYTPDYKRLNLPGLDPDTKAMMVRRVYDLAAVTDKSVAVYLNGEMLPVRNFVQYTNLYFEGDHVAECNGRWSVVVAPSDEFRQVSFVNGICTTKGGKHVDDVVGQIVKRVGANILQKKKVEVKPSIIRELMTVFVDSCIENPSFDSQSKECLTTPVAKFGSRCELSEKFIEKVAKLITTAALEIADRKDAAALKKTDGAKKRTIRGIPKLSDAAMAGTAESHLCVLYVCEGDSAMAGIKSGMSQEDRKYKGVFPIRGKLLNPRRNPHKVAGNAEIVQLKQILGFESGRVYTTEEAKERLRYGEVRIMADQDLDGAHIKGLFINLIDTLWPSLVHDVPRFLSFTNTPIIKAWKRGKEKLFFNEGQYRVWLQEEGAESGWTVKYYKGLGTSTPLEFKQYMKTIAEGGTCNVVYYAWEGKESEAALDTAFDETLADARKRWLDTYDESLYVDTMRQELPYQDFVNQELIHFSNSDNHRSIPSVIDGFKPSQRKILFAAFRKPLTKEVKVAQFSGYVSEISAYHHGENSLSGAIVKMAQTFVGSNNLNLLKPNGQFGTRLQGGKDSAQERYIYTELSPETRKLFPSDDDAVLEYLQDDGLSVEPRFYAPIIPMILVNGGRGIGTGHSTDVPCFDPAQVKRCIVERLKGRPYSEPFVPFYRGFKGRIEAAGPGKFSTTGLFQLQTGGKTIKINELPIGVWTDDYKGFLDGLCEAGTIKDFTDNSTDVIVSFVVKVAEPLADVEKTLKLTTTLSTTNMTLFDPNGKLKRYKDVEEIVDDYLPVRMEVYRKRKATVLADLERQRSKASNKVRYIRAILEGRLTLNNVKKADLPDILIKLGLETRDDSFNYLTKMPMDTVVEENVRSLEAEMEKLETEVAQLNKTSETALWLADLEALPF
jgi:DNA topoisomerase-2